MGGRGAYCSLWPRGRAPGFEASVSISWGREGLTCARGGGEGCTEQEIKAFGGAWIKIAYFYFSFIFLF